MNRWPFATPMGLLALAGLCRAPENASHDPGRNRALPGAVAVVRGQALPEALSEWLRRWAGNPLCSACGGSNPTGVVCFSAASFLMQFAIGSYCLAALVLAALWQAPPPGNDTWGKTPAGRALRISSPSPQPFGQGVLRAAQGVAKAGVKRRRGAGR